GSGECSNVQLSAHNMGYDACRYIGAFSGDAIGELHLGGFTREPDDGMPGAEVLIDTHAEPIAEPVWDLYAHAIRRFGPQPTLIEWAADTPPFATLLGEAARADEIAGAILAGARSHAPTC